MREELDGVFRQNGKGSVKTKRDGRCFVLEDMKGILCKVSRTVGVSNKGLCIQRYVSVFGRA